MNCRPWGQFHNCFNTGLSFNIHPATSILVRREAEQNLVLCHPSHTLHSTDVLNSWFCCSLPPLCCWVFLTSCQHFENWHGMSLTDGSGLCTYKCYRCVWVLFTSKMFERSAHHWVTEKKQACSLGSWMQSTFLIFQYILLSITRIHLEPKYFLSPLCCLVFSKYWSFLLPAYLPEGLDREQWCRQQMSKNLQQGVDSQCGTTRTNFL